MATNQAVNPPVPVTILKSRYVLRIKKHLHNRIEIIEIELNRKEYESLHPLLKCSQIQSENKVLTPTPEYDCA